MITKFQDTAESKLYVSGCLHLNHDPKWKMPLWKARGFLSSKEMTDDIINGINKKCRKEDNLLVLGDFCLNTQFCEFLDLLDRINPKIWMIEGNHPNPWLKEYEKWSIEEFGHLALDVDWRGMRYMGHYISLKWNNKSFVANHYPFAVWDGCQNGVLSIHSHNHGSYTPSLPKSNVGGKQLDCGYDVHRAPLSFEEITLIMDNKDIEVRDHHDAGVRGGF
tara:strand:+ start:33053 stop:33712 length:660 start_codon:yes stop_codon:yes gene_type:complete